MRLRVAVLVGFVVGHVIGLLGVPAIALAGTSSLVISELQPGYSGHSGDEFVELYNPTAADVSISKWVLQYKSATGSSWTSKVASLTGTVKAHGFYLIGAGSYAASADFKPSSLGFADTAGVVRLTDASQIPADTVAWGGGAVGGEGDPVPAPMAGGSLERKPGPYMETAGNGVDTGDNASDFVLRPTPGPQTTASALEVPTVIDPADIDYAAPELTEVLPLPQAPQTAAHDSFVELHNTASEPVYVGGYSLTTKTGIYDLPGATVPAAGYLAIMASSSHLDLTAGTSVQLLDPSGAEVDETASWDTPVAGQAWALMPDGWLWTTTPTAGGANVETDPIVANPDDSTDPTASNASLELTELLPDPAAPATDANDEFVEVYNPSGQPVDLTGYMLKSGGSLGNKASLSGEIVPAGGYVALTSGETGLPLANDGSTVGLFDPTGQQLDIVTYGAAKAGQAWADIDGTWAWTTTPTPGSANILTAPAVLGAATSKTTKAKAAAKPKAAKATKAKAAAKAKTAKTKTTAAKTVLASVTSPGGHWLLYGLVGLTIGYVIYEFRYDLQNYYYRLRGHAGGSGAVSSLVKRWRRARAGQ